MVKLSKSKFAFLSSADRIPVNLKGHVYLWTFTFAKVISAEEATRLWSEFLNQFRKWNKKQKKRFQGLRVFEQHPGREWIFSSGEGWWDKGGHGLHVHVVSDCYWLVNEVRRLWYLATKIGGRVHVKPLPHKCVSYLAKYLSKAARPEHMKGKRMWASFGGFDHTRVKDVEVECEFTRIYRYLERTVRDNYGVCFNHFPFWQRKRMVDNVSMGLPWNWSTHFTPSWENDAASQGINIYEQ